MSHQSQIEGIPLANNPNPVLVSISGGGGGGTSAVDGAAFIPGVSGENPIGGIVDDVATSTVNEGETGAARITPYRAIHNFIVNAVGVALGTLTAPFRVDPTGTTTQPVTVKDSTNVSCMDDGNHALKVNVVAGGVGGGPVTIADGADIVEGTTTDVAITSNVSGTISGKLRGLIAILADVWDDASNLLRVSIQNATLAVTQSGIWSVRLQDGSGNVINSTANAVNVNVTNASVPVTGALTDTELRATPVPISGTITANAGTNLNTSGLAIETGGNLTSLVSNSGATTDAAVTTDVNATISSKLRGVVKILGNVWDSVNSRLNVFIQNATLAVTQSGTWVSRLQDGSGNAITSTSNALDVNVKNASVAVTGPLTDTQLRASAVPISGTVTANAGTNLNTSLLLTQSDYDTLTGGVTETAPATDTASSGLNGRLQRIAQRLTSLIALLPSALSGSGNFKVAVSEALPAGTNAIGKLSSNSGVTIGAVEVAASQTIAATQATASNFNAQVVGNIANDGVDSGNPVKIGGRAVSSEPTPVAHGDRADFLTDLVGKHIVMPYANPENFISGVISTAMTGTASTSLIAAPGSGLRNYITQITVSNSHATQGTDIIIQDGSGGTILYVIPAAAVYGGASITFPVPLRQPTANTALYCANVTSGANTKVSASGFKGA